MAPRFWEFWSFLSLTISKGDLDAKKTTPNIEVCPESLRCQNIDVSNVAYCCSEHRVYLKVEVYEPSERVLVHRLYIGQVWDAEKQDGRMSRHRFITITSLVNFFLCRCGDFL